MEKFTTLTSTPSYLPIDNIDTDMIIAKQYLKTIKRSGLGKWLFASMRYDAEGKPIPAFPLNEHPETTILMAGKNFGCGSSREHAPWSLTDFGIRAVIASSFADIFYNNCFKNGLLPVKLEQPAIEAMAACGAPVTIDLTQQSVTCGDMKFSFALEPNNKKVLLEGLDTIASVLVMSDDIKAYETKHFAQQPWLM